MDAKYMRDLMADRAKAEEDLRIARKHTIEAAERKFTQANHRAYLRALQWENTCRARRNDIRGECIRANAAAREV